MTADKTALSYWFPKLEAARLPVPRTIMLSMPGLAMAAIWKAFDGQDGTPEERSAADRFVDDLKLAAEQVGYPIFLRTDHTSGKHEWEKTCFVASPDDIKQHVFDIVQFSECCGLLGLPWDRWAVREFLPTIPLGVCPDYGNMPICREFRFFVEDDAIRCHHPYWPKESLVQGGVNPEPFYAKLCHLRPGDYADLSDLARAAGRAVGGAWSVDILQTRRGWFVTDMAEAEKSFHWEGCPTRLDDGSP